MTKRGWWWIGIVGAVFTLGIGAIQWWKCLNFGYNGLDLGIYSQVVWSLAHGQGFASSIHDPSYLGDHLELWLVPISWLYRLWSSPLLLLFIQTVVLVSTIIPLAKITRRLLDQRAALIAVTLFCLHPLVYNLALYEFHALTLIVPLLAWSIWWYLERRLGFWLLALTITVLAREDVPLVIAGWGIMALIDRRSWRWWLPAFGMAAVWFPTAQAIIHQANHDGLYKYLAFYQWLGSSPIEMATFPFRHPWLFLNHTITFNNLGTIVGLASTVGFLCFVRPKRLWPLCILGAQLLLGNAQPGTWLRIHYAAPYIPFLLWAALETYAAFRRGELWPKIPRAVSSLLVPTIAVISPIYALFIIGPAEWPWTVRREASTSAVVLQTAVDKVQPTDRVLTTFALLPQLANRQSLYSLNYVYLGRRQYSQIPYTIPTVLDVAIIDWQQLYEFQYLYRDTLFNGQSGPQRIAALLDQNNLRLSEQIGTVSIYRPGGGLDDSTRVTSADAPVTQTIDHLAYRGLNELRVQVSTPLQSTIIRVVSNWTSTEPRQDELTSLRFNLTQNGRIIWTTSQILGQGLHPSSEWSANEPWQAANTLVVPSKLTGRAQLEIQVVEPSGRYRLDRWRQFRPIIDSEKVRGSIALGTVDLAAP